MKVKSFRDLLSSQPTRDLPLNHEDNFLFTKLKRQKDHRLTVPNSLQTSLQSQEECSNVQNIRMNIEILKLEKANFVAEQHLATGKPIKLIMQSVAKELQEDIEKVLKGTVFQSVHTVHNKSMRTSKNLGSTIQKTSSPSVNALQTSIQRRNEQWKSKTPKIIEFTLGNMGNDSKQSKKSAGSSQSGQVSEFMGKMVASKQIKQKLIGFK